LVIEYYCIAHVRHCNRQRTIDGNECPSASIRSFSIRFLFSHPRDELVHLRLQLHHLGLCLQVHLVFDLGADAVGLGLAALAVEDQHREQRREDGKQEAQEEEGRRLVGVGNGRAVQVAPAERLCHDPAADEEHVYGQEGAAGEAAGESVDKALEARAARLELLVGVANGELLVGAAAQAQRQHPEQGEGELRVAVEEAVEGSAVEEEHGAGRERAGIGRVRAAVDEGQLAEEGAGAKPRQGHLTALVVGVEDLHLAADDDVEVVALFVHPEDGAVCRAMLLVQVLRQLTQLGRAERVEKRDGAEKGFVHGGALGENRKKRAPAMTLFRNRCCAARTVTLLPDLSMPPEN
jgi:hypothetical protein